MDIVAAGMVCSVGLTAESACAAIRARVAQFEELPYLDSRVKPIVGAVVPGLDEGLTRLERLSALLAAAVSDCVGSSPAVSWSKVPLLLGLAEPERPGSGAVAAESIRGEVEWQLGVAFHPQYSRSFPRGHVSGMVALDAARVLLRSGHVPACLVAGVDSFVNAHALRWLEASGRLKTEENSDGIIPGEASAAVLVRPRGEPGDGTTASVMGIGFASEQATVLSEDPLLGLGLTAAVRSALAESGLALHQIDFRLSDVTGEQYGFREQALMLARLVRIRREALPIWHCTDSIGDTGAAASVCQLVIARQAFRRGYAPGPYALCCASSVTGERGASVLNKAEHRA